MVASNVLLLPEADNVGRDKQPPRKRARDEGTVTPLGVEIPTDVYAALDRCRVVKKWSKRTVVEEALRAYLVSEGFLAAATDEEDE